MSNETNCIDFGHLRSFTLGDEDLEAELLSLCETNMEKYLAELEQTIGGTDDWQEAAHKLKGVARSIGAFSFADQAEAAEHLREIKEQETRLQVLKEQALEVVATFKAYVAQKSD